MRVRCAGGGGDSCGRDPRRRALTLAGELDGPTDRDTHATVSEDIGCYINAVVPKTQGTALLGLVPLADNVRCCCLLWGMNPLGSSLLNSCSMASKAVISAT